MLDLTEKDKTCNTFFLSKMCYRLILKLNFQAEREEQVNERDADVF